MEAIESCNAALALQEFRLGGESLMWRYRFFFQEHIRQSLCPAGEFAEIRWKVVPHNATITVMLIPQFSLRSILAATAVCGFVSLIGAAAVRGAPWAAAVVIAIAALGLILVVHALMFFVVRVLSLLPPLRGPVVTGQSPFAQPAAREG